MPQLQQLLAYLGRDDVDEVRLETGAPVSVSQSGRMRPLTRHTVTAEQVRQVVEGTELEPLLPKGDAEGSPELVVIDGEPYIVMIAREQGRLQLRFGRPPGAASPSSANAKTPVDGPVMAAPGQGPGPGGAARSARVGAREPTPGPSDSVGARPASLGARAPTPGPSDSLGARPAPAGARASGSADSQGARPASGRGRGPSPRLLEALGSAAPGAPSSGRGPGPRAKTPGPRWRSKGLDPQPDGDAPAEPSPAEASASLARARTRSETMPESDPGWQAPAGSGPSVTPRAAHPVTSPEPAVGWSSSPARATAAEPPPVDEGEPRPRSTGERRAADELGGLLRQGRSRGASDVHVTADRPVALRVGGRLVPEGEPLAASVVQGMLDAVVPTRHAMQLQERGYCDFALDVPDAGRFRVNVARQRTGLKGCFRAVATVPPTLEQLGLPSELAQVTRYHQGLAVVSGPNGQGKTTTMAALVDLLNASKPIHIITVEDPVEVLHPRKRAVVSQREVGTHTRSFSSALKAALREDPDVIVIGELRDRETVEMAMSAAETGHLVIATMSTPSGAKTITRLIDMFPPDDQAQVRATLAGALKIVVSQRLVPRADGQGRVAAAELITGNVPLWSLIRDDKLFQLPSLLQRGRAFGMIRIEDSLSALVRSGAITEGEARRHADDPQGLRTADEPTPAPEAPSSGRAGWREGIRGFFDKGGS